MGPAGDVVTIYRSLDAGGARSDQNSDQNNVSAESASKSLAALLAGHGIAAVPRHGEAAGGPEGYFEIQVPAAQAAAAARLIARHLLLPDPISEADDPREGSILSEGLRVRYRLYGSGAPVLILSGGPGLDCDYMEPVARELSKSCAPVLVDLRGTGRSVPDRITHATTNLKLTLADLEAIRSQIGVERWPLVGHSAGAVLALAYAARYPRSVSALVLANSGPIRASAGHVEMDNLLQRLTASEREALAQAEQGNFGEMLTHLLPGYFYDRAHAVAVQDVLTPARFHAETARLLSAGLYAGAGDLRPALQNLDVPALVIAGRQDPCDPAMQYEIHLALKNSRLQFLDRCGHFPWIEQPAGFYQAVAGFLAGNA